MRFGEQFSYSQLITYDAVGNVTYDGFHSYTYDAENRMLTVDGGAQAYFYDGLGRPILTEDNGNTYRVFGLNDRTETAFLSFTWILSELYIGGMGDYLGNYSNGTTYFAHNDQVGTRRMYTGPTGSWVESCGSLPFGDGLSCTGTAPTSPTQFTGQDLDPATNLHRFPARNYASSMGRFMTTDWAAKATAVPYADFSDPQTLNLYGYLRNSPLNKRDESGHCIWDGCIFEIATAVAVGGTLLYKAGMAYYHAQEAKNWGTAARESGRLLTNPKWIAEHGKSVDQVDKQNKSEYMKAAGKTVQTGAEVLDLLHSAGSTQGGAATEGGQAVEKALGEGIEKGTEGVQKATEQQAGQERSSNQANQQQEQQQPGSGCTATGESSGECTASSGGQLHQQGPGGP